ncbi:transport and Golgi organization protein 1 isoform X2 [Apis dorsata]|uniref:transport and Golgi organization protein 1 isoform X2 n=1 Tax=Apis dorsata TaxID=7462 RepID=UPI0003DF66E0|nr:transport and Golgi organization protein 1 isoform X2 [Apis dorsata]
MLVVMWNCNSKIMTKMNLFIKILFLVIAIIFSAIPQCSSVLSDKRLCYDPNCSEPISLARTTIKYIPNELGLLSFNVNEKVTVYSKEAGKRKDLWGVEINGKHGYVSKSFIKEYKVLHKDLQYEVSIDPLFNNNVSSNNKLQPKQRKNKSVFDKKDIKQIDNLDLKSTKELPQNEIGVTPSYQIIDGTTVHLNHNEPSIEPTLIKDIIQATVVPNKQNTIDETLMSTKDKLESKEKIVEVDIKDFVISSEKILDLPDLIHSSPLNISAISDKIEYATENENESFTDEKDQSLKKNDDTNDLQISISDISKETLNIKGEEIVELIKKDNINSNEVIENIDTKLHIQNIENTDQIKEPDILSSASHIKTDLQNAKNSNEIDVKDNQALENIINETKLEVQNAEIKNIQASQDDTIATSDIKVDIQNMENSYKIEIKDLQSPESIIATSNDITSNIQSIEKSNEFEIKDIQFLQNVTINTISDIKSDEQNVESSPEIETKDIQSSENLVITTNEIKSNISNIENSDGIEINNNTLLEDITINTKNMQYFENVIQSNTDQDNIKKEEEVHTSIENLNKYDNDQDLSLLFLTQNIKDKMSVISSAENIETENIEHKEAISKIESNSKKIVDIEDTMLIKETSSDKYDLRNEDILSVTKETSENIFHEIEVTPPNVCIADNVECSSEDVQKYYSHHEQISQNDENAIISGIQIESNHWLTLMYLSVTAIATLIFSLGYYCIENMRSDKRLIARINKLEKDLLISEAECTMVNENLKSTKEKLSRMEDESFGSDEMVISLRADLKASQNAKAELEDQVAMLEKDLESATEAGLELEKMLREVLSSNNEVNPLAQSVEDLQTRLNAQQAANESLTNALNLKTQELEFDKLENESLSTELAFIKKKYEEFEVEFTRVTENLKLEINSKNIAEQTLIDKVQQLEMRLKEISIEKATLEKELKGKEVEIKDLVDVINRLNSNNLDLDKLYDVSHIKAEAKTLFEERNELKIRLAEIEGVHNLLEEHVKVVKEEMATLTEQCKIAEKEKKDAETRLEVLTNFFEEKEAQRQKEEAIWLQQQGEVVSTVERIQTMQNEIQNYKQQVEVLKREILDQEREYKNQISLLETKAHEQWVVARQVERRLEESKVEAGQLRNRLTLIEKNINDVDPEVKLHRLEANGEMTTSPPLYLGAESSSSPIMFSGSSGVPPPPPPSYLHSLFPPYLPPPLPNASGVPPYEVSQRPPPLGGRLSSPPPMPLHPPTSNRYDNAGSPPPMSPHILPPFDHRSPPPPPPASILPLPLGTSHSWGEESLPPPRNSGFHPTQRERVRNHKGSLHSSGESLDKSHHNSKV